MFRPKWSRPLLEKNTRKTEPNAKQLMVVGHNLSSKQYEWPQRSHMDDGLPYHDSKYMTSHKFYQDPRLTILKPEGLWYAYGDQWSKLCADLEWEHKEKDVYNLEINLNEICVLKSFTDLLNFGERFGRVKGCNEFIRWNDVADNYKGIEISGNLHTYFDMARKSNNYSFIPWFYGFDVEGGCLWDLSVITEFEIVAQDWCLHNKHCRVGGDDAPSRKISNYVATVPLLLTVFVSIVWETCTL